MQDSRRGVSDMGGRPPRRNNPNQVKPPSTEQRSKSRRMERPLRGVINTISGGFADGGPLLQPENNT